MWLWQGYPPAGRFKGAARYPIAALVMIAAAGLALLVNRFHDIPNVGVLFVVLVIATGLWLGTGPAWLAGGIALASDILFYAPTDPSPQYSAVRLIIFTSVTIAGVMLTRLVRQEREVAANSERRWMTTLKSIGDAVIATDAAGMITFMNHVAEELTGWSLSEAAAKPVKEVFNIIDEHTRREVDSPVTKVLVAGMIVGLANHTILVRKDGTEVPIDDSGAPIRDAAGAITGVVLIFRDQTAEREAKRNLVASETRYRRLFEAARDGILVLDADTGRIVDVNPYLVEMLGYSHGEFLGQALWEIGMFKDIAASLESFLELQDKGYVRYEDLPLETVDGRRLEVEFVSNVYLVGDEKVIQCNIRDISERRRAEKEQAKLQTQLGQAQRMESVGRLAGGIAHDFNNMLAVILGHAEMALAQVDPAEPLQADLHEIQKAAERSADLTRQLLAFARQQTVAPEVLDLNEIIEGMLRMLQRLISEDIDLAWRPGANLPPVKIDPAQIHQLLVNLCVNARDAIAGVGRIIIETGNAIFDEAYCADHAGSIPGEYVTLTANDNGCGMEKEILEHVFEPFFTTKGLGQGTGLGLATVYGIVKQNNGFINVYSEPGQGTTIRVYLPRHEGGVGPSPKEGQAETVSRGVETVLLAEDEPAVLFMGKVMLESLGYRVLVAASPSEALRLAGEHPGEIHLLVTDVIMPEMNGRDLAKRLQSFYPNLKYLFMSGYPADVIAHNGMLEASVNFIQKPFSKRDLAEKVRETLGQT